MVCTDTTGATLRGRLDNIMDDGTLFVRGDGGQPAEFERKDCVRDGDGP